MLKQLLLGLVIVFILMGCEEKSNPEDKEENSHISFNTGRHDGEDIQRAQYADITFTNYTYSPFTRNLCFDVYIIDSKYYTS